MVLLNRFLLCILSVFCQINDTKTSNKFLVVLVARQKEETVLPDGKIIHKALQYHLLDSVELFTYNI